MKYTRLYTGADGRSHFEDVELPLNKSPTGLASELVKATGIIFMETESNFDLKRHNAPRRQFLVNIDGEVEITVGDGTKRRFGPGDYLLAEDTTGEGHTTRALSGKPRKSLFITLD